MYGDLSDVEIKRIDFLKIATIDVSSLVLFFSSFFRTVIMVPLPVDKGNLVWRGI